MGTKLERAVGQEPSAEFSVRAAEEANRMLAELRKDTHVQIARFKPEGFTNREIAEQLGVIERTETVLEDGHLMMKGQVLQSQMGPRDDPTPDEKKNCLRTPMAFLGR